jgi:hypothetical protein
MMSRASQEGASGSREVWQQSGPTGVNFIAAY